MVTNKYEVVMVFSLKDGEENVTALKEKFKKLIEENGTIESVEEWGKRRLAYPIDDQNDAFYVLTNFESETSFPAELDRVSKITDGVLRTMVIKK
ncbi:MAG: 30S ribosomal protein S6 [Oscillospiraceae bacterium]|nr:30S ribosomal protein S6 [Oscillospiraceae bacterium]